MQKAKALVVFVVAFADHSGQAPLVGHDAEDVPVLTFLLGLLVEHMPVEVLVASTCCLQKLVNHQVAKPFSDMLEVAKDDDLGQWLAVFNPLDEANHREKLRVASKLRLVGEGCLRVPVRYVCKGTVVIVVEEERVDVGN